MNAIIDLGSSYLKMTIYKDRSTNTSFPFMIVSSKSDNLRLIDHIQNGKMTPQGIALLMECLAMYKQETIAFKVKTSEVFVVATEVLRRSENRKEITESIRRKFGWDVSVITGKDEAKFVFESIRNTLFGITSGVILDVGGGSTEIIEFKNNKIGYFESFPFGLLTAKKRLKIISRPSTSDYEFIRKRVQFLWKQEKMKLSSKELIVVGGAAYNVGVIFNYFEGVTSSSAHGKIITLPELQRTLTNVSKINTDELELIPNFDSSRKDTIELAMCIFVCVMEMIGATNFLISKYSLREGVLLSKTK